MFISKTKSVILTDVLIIGAGPVGLVLANQLRIAGMNCYIIDKLAQPSPYAKALGLHSSSLRIFEQLGILKQALNKGLIPVADNFYYNGKFIEQIRIPSSGSTPLLLLLEQTQTEALLTESLLKLQTPIHRDAELVALQQKNTHVIASVQSANKSVYEVECQYVVGCDGARSTTRSLVGIPFEGLRYPEEFALADLDVDWQLPADETQRFSSDDGLLFAAPIRSNGKRYRLSFHFKHESPPTYAPNTMIEHGPNTTLQGGLTLKELQVIVEKRVPYKAQLTNIRWSSRYRISKCLAARYSEGRVFLAGDAAHIHPPTGGLGMNTGIQDVANLASKLVDVLQRKVSPDLLDNYSLERRAIGEKVLLNSHQAFSPDKKNVHPLRHMVQEILTPKP